MTAFDDFWAIYPRRVAKLDAMKAFAKALKLATADEIIAGARRYAALGLDPQFTKYPAGWLRSGMWMDEQQAPKLTGMAALEAELRNEIDDYRNGTRSPSDRPQADQALSLFGWEGHQGTSRPH